MPGMVEQYISIFQMDILNFLIAVSGIVEHKETVINLVAECTLLVRGS
jgi:hypothetical protein